MLAWKVLWQLDKSLADLYNKSLYLIVRCASYLTAGVDLGFPKGNAKLGTTIAHIVV